MGSALFFALPIFGGSMISFEYVKTTFSPDVVIRLQTLRRLARNTRKAAHGNLPAPFEVLLEGLEMRLLRQGSQAFLESYPIVFSMVVPMSSITIGLLACFTPAA